MNTGDSVDLLRSIGELSELALAIGHSIDLQENCDYFFKHLLSRKNLSAVSVWVAQERDGDRGYECDYQYPAGKGSLWLAEDQADWPAWMGAKNLCLLRPGDEAIPGFLGDLESAVLLFRNDVGFVALRSYLWLDHDLSRAEEGQLGLLLEKFLRTVEGCLLHRRLLGEMAAHKESQARERELKSRISRMERLERISEVIGYTAHDLNNLFSPLVAYPEMILHDLPPNTPPSVIQDIGTIKVSAQAASSILDDLLSISRNGRRVEEPVDLPKVVTAFAKLASFRNLKQRYPSITFGFSVEGDIPSFHGAEVQCTRALLNLVTNACEEMPDGGRIVTSVKCIEYLDPFPGYEEIPAGTYAVLEVQDNANGIPREILDHIFEPYVSRKEMGQSGSGLGLAVVYGVVKHADGFVDVQTSADTGTCFRLHFPVPPTPVNGAP